jgi:hypothetical protein
MYCGFRFLTCHKSAGGQPPHVLTIPKAFEVVIFREFSPPGAAANASPRSMPGSYEVTIVVGPTEER